MHRILVTVPALGWRLHSFSAALALACLAAYWLTLWRARRERIDPDAVSELAIWLMSGGFIGARALYILSHPGSVRSVADLFKVWQGGIVFYGCIMGGLIGSLLYWWRRPFPFLAMADAVAPALAIGCALGRVGCFLNGCCYGCVSNLPWALTFPAESPPWARHVELGLIPITMDHSLPVQPAQLYAVLDGLILLGLLSWYFPRRRRDGEIMALLMVSYAISRFAIEALRGDEPALALGMTMSQGISVGLLAAGTLFWVHLIRQPKIRWRDRIETRSHEARTLREPFDLVASGQR